MNRHLQLASNFILLAFYLLFLSSCNQSCNRKRLSTDNEQRTTIHRYEQALFKLNPNNLSKELPSIQKEYKFFIGDNFSDEYNIKQMQSYLNDPMIKGAYDDCMKAYPKIDDIEIQLSEAFKNYKTYFPNAKIPKVFTYVSGFDFENPVKYADSVIVIALDMYLGAGNPNYSKLGIPEYIRQRFSKEYIVRDCMRRLALAASPNSGLPTQTLLDVMIQKGRILYFVHTVMPELQDEINMSYTGQQLAWCKSNESNLWAFLINNKLLFTTDNNTVVKFVGDAPFTSVISQEAPGRIGEWIGWQIVRSYMENNKNISLSALMKESNYQQILNNSLYKPRK